MSVVQSVWIGRPFKRVELLCMKSFLDHGHEFHLYLYEPFENLPDGVIVKDANQIIPEDQIYLSDGGRLSSFANWFRWALLARLGGLYVDMDMICLKPFKFDDDVIFGWERDDSVNNAVLGFPKGHFLPRFMAKACDDVNLFQPIDTIPSAVKKIGRRLIIGREKSRPATRFTEPGGPYYFTRFLRHFDLIDQAKPIDWFYPVAHNKGHDLFDASSDARARIANSYGIHFWNGKLADQFKTGNTDQAQSVFDDLYRAHFGDKDPFSR